MLLENVDDILEDHGPMSAGTLKEEPETGNKVLHRKAIEREKIGRVQRMVDYSTSRNNPVQAPFIALD